MGDDGTVGEHYRRTRRRLTGLLGELDAEAWATPVAACPGWKVHDVVSHVVGIAEDALAGRLTGPPPESMTAEQVARHSGGEPKTLLDHWDDIADEFEELISSAEAWPAAMDVASHEQDIRTALDRPGARDDPMIRIGARRLIELLDVDGTIRFDFGDTTVVSPARRGPTYELRTTPFEVFRLRLGRRTPGQVAGMDWSSDPSALFDQLFLFGPADEPLVE